MATFTPSVEQWRSSLILPAMANNQPLDFLLAFLQTESGGNSCSLGIPGVEAGIAQTYHPADDRFGATYAQLRENCEGSTLVAPLSSAQRERQVRSLIGLVNDLRTKAKTSMASAGVSWSTFGADFWNLVKLGHGLPVLQGEMLRQVTVMLGHPPRSWQEYRDAVMATPASAMPSSLYPFAVAASTAGRTNRIEDVLANAEATGRYGAGIPPYAGFALFAAAGGLLIYLMRR